MFFWYVIEAMVIFDAVLRVSEVTRFFRAIEIKRFNCGYIFRINTIFIIFITDRPVATIDHVRKVAPIMIRIITFLHAVD